jgi:hypothetical protein
MDSIQAKFFWRGVSEEFKYHMVKLGGGRQFVGPKIWGWEEGVRHNKHPDYQ